MYAKSYGIHANHHQVEIIEVEVHLGSGLPMIITTGNLSTKTKEGVNRIKSALSQIGIRIPPKRITINLSPSKVYKTSTSLDLPICMALVGAMGIFPKKELERTLFIGEMGLNGEIKVSDYMDTLPSFESLDIRSVILPHNQHVKKEEGLCYYAFDNLKHLIRDFTHSVKKQQYLYQKVDVQETKKESVLANIRGQESAIKGLSIAIAGRHPCILIGPPGVGKSMLARHAVELMPPLSDVDKRQIEAVYQARLDYYGGIPLRVPDVAISYSSMFGGGAYPKPGEVSLAHRGILVMEEMTDFKNAILRGLRGPLEEKKIQMVRKRETYEYPTDFLLIGTMNLCQCGALNREDCICTKKQKERYLYKLSHSLLDRIHMLIDVKQPHFEDLENRVDIHKIKEQIMYARKRQIQRQQSQSLIYLKDWEDSLVMGKSEKDLMAYLYEQHKFSVRTYLKFIQLVRTIGDMQGEEQITDLHIMEALLYQNYLEKP